MPYPMRPERTIRRTPFVIGTVFCSLFAVIGGVLAVATSREVLESSRLAHGLTATGTIDGVTPTSWSGSKGRRYYGFTVRYHFEHDGQTHSSTRWGVKRWSSGSQGRRDSAMGRYTPGQPVTVYFEPGVPQRAVIDPHVQSDSLVGMLLGVMFAVLAATAVPMFRPSKFHEPDLPANVARITGPGDSAGFIVRAPNARAIAVGTWVMVVAVASTVLVGFGLHSVASLEPGQVFLGVGAVVLASVLTAGIGLALTPAGAGDMEIDPVVQRIRIRKRGGRGFASEFAFETILGADEVFRPQKNARNPDASSAIFCPAFNVLDDGSTRRLKLTQFTLTRDDSHEFIGWLRHELALDSPELAAAS